MSFKRISTLIIAAAAVLTYNGFVNAQDEKATLPEVPSVSEASPFENATTEIKKTTTTVEKVKIEDIEPAILMELKPEVKEITTEKTVTKEAVTEEGKTVEIKKTTTDTLKIDEKGVTDTKVETTEVQEVKKETLPVLEEIKLPAMTEKPVNNEPVKIEVSSQRIPAGTVIPLRLESSINSIASSIGDQFNASLTSDIIINDKIVLPAGTIVRGTIGKLQKAGMLVREAKVLLIFDHIVTPVGKQVPIYSYLTGSPSINYEGFITGGTSYGKSFKKDASKSKDILVNTTTFGVEKGLEYWAGVPVVLTAPLCAIGGTLGGGGYLIGKSVYNLFKQGAEVLLEPGTAINMTLSKALDVPVN